MHKPFLILLTLPRQPEWLAVCAKSWARKKEEKKGEEKKRVKSEKEAVVKNNPAELNGIRVTADMIEKMPFENQSVPNKRA